MMCQGLNQGNLDFRFHLADTNSCLFRTQIISSIGYGSSVTDDRPIDIYIDKEDIDRIIMALEELKRECGYLD